MGLNNLREVYQLFKNRVSTETVGFSKFADSRPNLCILAGASATHPLCVCTIHQNVKLIMLGVHDLTAYIDVPHSTYHNCSTKRSDLQPTPINLDTTWVLAIFVQASLGSGLIYLPLRSLATMLSSRSVCLLIHLPVHAVTKPADELVTAFCETLEHFLPHLFIANAQASFYKSTLQPVELLVQ